MPTIVHVTTSLPTYVPKRLDYQPSDGGQPRDSLGRSSLEGDSSREPPFNPPIAYFGWLTPNLRMFIPPWYQSHVVQLVLELATKLP